MEMIIVPNLLDYDGDKASMCSVNNQHPRECKAQKFDFYSWFTQGLWEQANPNAKLHISLTFVTSVEINSIHYISLDPGC